MLSSSRRHFLRSSTSVIALPFLQSLGFRRFASAAAVSAAPPKRMIFLGTGFGVTSESWYPDTKDTGYDYTIPECLKPLAAHQKDFSILQHLEHANSRDGHSGSTFWLTGADRFAIPGRSFHNTISVDQVAANQFGSETRYASLHLDGDDLGGHGTGSISWNQSGKPILGLQNPVALYHKLFSSDSIPFEQRQAMLSKERSALDTVLSDARSIKHGLTKTDVDKLDEYFESIRDIEKRIAKEESWLQVPKKTPPSSVKEPGEGLEGAPAVEAAYDLMVAAMQVDATRVFTYRLPADSFCASIGADNSAHNLSHYAGKELTGESIRRDQAHAKLLAHLIGKLKSANEADGSSLFDNVTVVFGSNLRTKHSLNNCPTLVAGGGAGFKHGRHLVMKEDKTPLCNLWLSALRGSGIQAESFGDSTGVIDELFEA
ncbi:Protein of unknown function [Neorhodopirellula lusitana]|uniref:Secreted protein containing DUF1552 n=1 Tax=Neorhodopirellula lusitana TaxID=445327 RepID=A0ABY1QE73_9BACT|nr:DUF1552 domain-containing protein [Neorhodopirellula lusitana]SMP68979.1 Protein of unknown function [Neorhodopirellula lusitana]